MVREFLDVCQRVGGAAVAHLIEDRRLTRAELDELSRMVRRTMWRRRNDGNLVPNLWPTLRKWACW